MSVAVTDVHFVGSSVANVSVTLPHGRRSSGTPVLVLVTVLVPVAVVTVVVEWVVDFEPVETDVAALVVEMPELVMLELVIPVVDAPPAPPLASVVRLLRPLTS